MGYYSSFRWEIIGDEDVKVSMKGKEELEKFFSSSSNHRDISGFCEVEIILDEKGNLYDIDLYEYYAKFYDERLFAEKFKDIIETGKVRFYFYGEDDSVWGYEITPGKIESLYSVFLNETQYNRVKEVLGENLI